MPTPVTDPDVLAQLNAPDRAPVQSAPNVWGDTEAVQSGLYEAPKRAPGPRPVTDPALLAQLNGEVSPSGRPRITVRPAGFTDRFYGESAPPLDNEQALRSGLTKAGVDMTRGPAVPPMANALIDFQNQRAAASQGTTPNINAQQPNLISTDVFESDSGEIMYRDPNTGEVVPTDQSKHVALRDPNDNRVKIFARNTDTNESAAVGVARVLAPGLAAGAPTARAAIGAAKGIQPLASDIFSTAKPAYREFTREASKIDIPVETAKGIADRLRLKLAKSGFIEELASPIYSAIRILESGEPITLDVLQSIKRVVGRGFNSPDKNIRDAASVVSGDIMKVISEVSPSAAANLKKGDAIHSTALAVQDLQRKGSVADLRTGRAGYGGNAVNAMRQVMSPIVQKAIEGRSTLFKPNEIAAMREIVEGTNTTNNLRLAGQLSPSKGIIQTVGAGGAAYTVGPAAVAIPAIGMASNKLATILTGRQIDRLKELVAKRSPEYAKAVQKATERYYRAQEELALNPSSAKLGAYVSASRSLASGLTRDGIPITSGDLMRAIQGPMSSAAENE